ncbi:MAG: hypothetical protein Q8918_15380 [Bacteroidota bacterium]|nr:hypothetical protein [Bacteroidota bacterium]MDP4213345.1 hypothetical protein [Bacteroidota bacterium]MDP4251484.1 hypothetical protein [Bacteroidota bacterium]
MAISESLLLKKLSGQLGKELVFRQYGNKTVVSKYPDMSKRVLSPGQLRANQIMEEANYEAKRILGDEAQRNAAQVRLNVTRNKLYTALIKEYFKNVRQESGTAG